MNDDLMMSEEQEISRQGDVLREDNVQKEPEKRKSGKGGFFPGLLAGIVIMGILLGLGLPMFCKLTNNYIIIGGRSNHLVSDSQILDKKTVEKVDELAKYMDLYYYEEYDEQKIRDAILAGEMAGLGDPYSVYYTAEEFADQQVDTSGVYYGIGAGLTQDPTTMQVTVIKIYEGTPSEEAGMKKDDIIETVDDIDATSMELTELVRKIRGEEGTSVHIKVYRPSEEKELEFDVERRNVELPSVTGKMLQDGIAYIQISEFQKNTATQFEKILDGLVDEGMQSMIIDVRSNPGGMLSAVVQILDDILPEGTVVYTQDKYGNREDYTSEVSCMDYPIAVLMDEHSASASEIFAGAIKDYDYGTLIGTTTFGKGIVQTVFPLSDGDALKITTAKYYTPDGDYIHGKGIEPDIELEYEYSGSKEEEYSTDYDNQVQKAIEVLKGNK